GFLPAAFGSRDRPRPACACVWARSRPVPRPPGAADRRGVRVHRGRPRGVDLGRQELRPRPRRDGGSAAGGCGLVDLHESTLHLLPLLMTRLLVLLGTAAVLLGANAALNWWV